MKLSKKKSNSNEISEYIYEEGIMSKMFKMSKIFGFFLGSMFFIFKD
jgi:hypothetical protein